MERRTLAVCHECLGKLRQGRGRASHTRFATLIIPFQTVRSFANTTPPFTPSKSQRDARTYNTRVQRVARFTTASPRLAEARSVPSNELNALHNRIFELTNSAIRSSDQIVPSEQRILYVLEQLESIARTLDATPRTRTRSAQGQPESTATSALLGSVNARQYPAFLSKSGLLNLVSEKAEEVIRHPNVFITPAVLRSYVELQSLLHQPSSFPDIFELYANKPTPAAANNGASVQYTSVSPDKVNAAVDAQTVNTALTTAIDIHDLPLSLDIITTTLCTPAYKKAKVLRQALVPAGLVAAAPLAAYGLSMQFGLLQHTMDPAYATSVAFAGIMTYVGTVCTLGYVVITTANDQMDRVTWAKGVPLWERWVREEERAALDRVAGKWGFQSMEKRGEEEGEEWESLREFVGIRGMVLDKVELMEGME